ncbi:hypothetical protein L9F63_024461, partial [Diploptera punctata]
MVRLTLSMDTQKALGCLIGNQVTSENPWTNVKKATAIAHITEKKTNTEIYQFKDVIKLEVESITKASRLLKRADFQNQDPDDVRDGYVYFEPRRDKFKTIARKRVDVAVQAIPETNMSIAQTVPPLPSNVWTQYEYHVDIPEEISGEMASPNLILGSPRDIYSLEFCPINANILVGGCINGQVVIWDISQKEKYLEESQELSEDRIKYRLALVSEI